MRVGMILEKELPVNPPDLRVEKEARSLVAAGYDVDILSLKINSTLDREIVNGLNTHRIPINMLSINEWEEELVERHFHSKDSPWVKAVEEFIEKNCIDAVHVHDLPLAWVSRCAATKMKIPIILDMHEVYPPMVEFMRSNNRTPWDPVNWVAQFERECVNNADRVIVTVEESKTRLIRLGIPEKKIVVVMNTENMDNMTGRNSGQNYVKDYNDKFIVTYVGAFGEIRGLEYLITATHKLLTQIPNIHLMLVGGGYNKPELEKLVDDLDIRRCVTITDWVGFEEVPRLIDISDVCAIPHIKNGFVDTTIPHKLFQYMLMAKPVVSTNIAPVERIVNECRCGVVVPDRDPGALSEALAMLAKSNDMRKQLGDNGQKAAMEKYNWKMEAEKLLALYGEVGKCNW